jgi:hypothetical protein
MVTYILTMDCAVVNGGKWWIMVDNAGKWWNMVDHGG